MRESKSGGHSHHGIGIGAIVAMFVSWQQWHSIGWMIVHGIFGWFYLLFWWLGACESRPI
jgi:hypothetical protein